MVLTGITLHLIASHWRPLIAAKMLKSVSACIRVHDVQVVFQTALLLETANVTLTVFVFCYKVLRDLASDNRKAVIPFTCNAWCFAASRRLKSMLVASSCVTFFDFLDVMPKLIHTI